MARIPEQTIEQIRSTSDIFEIVSEYVQLKKRGHNFFGLCPFHDEKTPSFSINPNRQIYKCFGCGAGGGTINFVMEVEQLEFIEAIQFLADRYKIEIDFETDSNFSKDTRSQLLELHTKVAEIFNKNLESNEGKRVVSHLLGRGFSKEIITQFRLGFSPNKYDSLLKEVRKHGSSPEAMKQSGLFISTSKGYMDRFRGRIMFSIFDSSGKIIAFAGRVFESDDPAKYVNSPETPIYNKSRILYGIHASKHEIRKTNSVIVVEGYFDFLQIFQSGIKNCVAISGTAFTEQHALQLKRYCNNVYLAYDGDSAGISAAIRTGYILVKAGISTNIVTIPKGIDPDDWIKTDGNKPLLDAIKNSNQLLNFHYKNFSEDISTNSGKSNYISEVLNELAQIKEPVTRELYAKSLSDLTQISINSIIESLQVLLNKKNKRLSYKKNNKIKTSTITNSLSLLEQDLLRLCFSVDPNIRKFLFENVKEDWLESNMVKVIYDKIYIHLHSEHSIEASLIMNDIPKDYREKLTEIIFDLEKLETSLPFARDCVKRLEENYIDLSLNNLRKRLKKAELENNDCISIIKQIDDLLKKKIQLSCYNEL